jgi:hypothetical protein
MLIIRSNFLVLFFPKFFLPSIIDNDLIMSFFLKVHIVSLWLKLHSSFIFIFMFKCACSSKVFVFFNFHFVIYFQDSFLKHLNFHSLSIIYFLVSKHCLFVQNFHIFQLQLLYIIRFLLFVVSCFTLSKLCFFASALCHQSTSCQNDFYILHFETITLILCC